MTLAFAVLAACAVLVPASATAEFPYPASIPKGTAPNDWTDQGWKVAATPESPSPYTNDPSELYGIRGARVVDSAVVETAFQHTTGRPDVTLAILDSGIKWNDAGPMSDLRRKVRLNTRELPKPQHADGSACAAYDCNGDGVVNVEDFASDPRVHLDDPRRVGPSGVLVPQDLTIAFSDGADDDHNGFTDDIAGWDFLDGDNDPFDDVQYGHGTGEAEDSSAEANNGRAMGTCPNCTFVPLRVGDSFVADVNSFAQAVVYATDNDVLVIQEALGTLNMSALGRDAVDYAYRHGVAVIASAADEAAQHHNWPSNYPHTIVVNSVNQYDQTITPGNPSYLQFNGCTNFSTHMTLAIPSSSCSSNATGNGAGFAGLVYSAALNAHVTPHPDCRRTNGDPCVLTANEVRQVMASGLIGKHGQADDVNFASCPHLGTGQPEDVCTLAEPSCIPALPKCTDPNLLEAIVAANRPIVSPLAETQSYPARRGFDEFYGYGRVNMLKAVTAASKTATIPPEAEITSPAWYAEIDPAKSRFDLRGQVFARAAGYTCRVEVAPGSEPNNGLTTDVPPGDFKAVPSTWCNGTTEHTTAYDGVLASIDLAALEARFPAATDFAGPEPSPSAPNFNNRPNQEPTGFTVRLVVTRPGLTPLTGQDRRNFYLHHDRDTLAGFPLTLPGDVESSPALADLDGDNRNELIAATSDGRVHAYRRDGSELPGWPVLSDPLPLHTGGAAFVNGELGPNTSHAAILASPAVGDLDGDGVPEVIAADFDGHVYTWHADGSAMWKRESNPDWSGKPLQPFVNVRKGEVNRTRHGFIGSPVIADLDGDGHAEVVAAAMDRHVYAWHGSNGSGVAGWPVLVVDYSKVASIDPVTHAIRFKQGVGARFNQGAIVDTPAVADITGDGKPEVVVGTNEEYDPAEDGGFAAGTLNAASLQLVAPTGLLDFANVRLFAIEATGDPGGPSADAGHASPYLPNWPVKMGAISAELLPVVAEGVTGSPVIAPVDCLQGGGGENKVGAESFAGPAYIWTSSGESCYGTSPTANGNQPNGMQTDLAAGTLKYDTPAIPAVGHPAFGDLGDGTINFLSPAAGLMRALDVAVNEYQRGQDFIGVWNASTGQFRPGFPSLVNDLQFLTGPSVADVDGLPGQEVIGGTASLDLNAINALGLPASPAWPKLTTDWMVANPLVGSFGQLETDSATKQTVVAATRSGYVFAYKTPAPACSAASWPRFHHDNANSGWYGRDAVLPGKPMSVAAAGGTLSWRAPGDDLLCGRAKKYEIVTSSGPIEPGNFADATALAGAPAPKGPGTDQSFALPAGAERYVAIRAVDEQGNVGRPAVVDTGAPGDGGGGGGDGGGEPGPGGAPPPPGVGAVLGVVRGCLSSVLRLTRHGFGPIRLGNTPRTAQRLLGAPVSRRGGVWRYCVRRGARLVLRFVRGHLIEIRVGRRVIRSR